MTADSDAAITHAIHGHAGGHGIASGCRVQQRHAGRRRRERPRAQRFGVEKGCSRSAQQSRGSSEDGGAHGTRGNGGNSVATHLQISESDYRVVSQGRRPCQSTGSSRRHAR